MKNYTFEELNDIEFESFVNDLLSKKNGWTIERFKAGIDGGIDGRLYVGSNKVIIQTKHFRASGINGLLSKIKSDEYNKAKMLSPDRYIFATSIPLNPADKSKIQSAFKDINLSTEDIIGNDEINAFLRECPDVLKTWYKLWAENSSTLELFIHPQIRSKELILAQRLNTINKLFVETEDIKPALSALKDKHAVVISGEPGVGKTTLAEYLCQWYMKMGYSIDVIEGDISLHPFNLQDKDRKILYYFDDFLGSNYFQAISGNSDSSIVRLIEHIKNEPHKRLILTSRSNIIQKAELFSQAYRSFGLTENRYVINISKYSKLTKGKILYSHLWHSPMHVARKHEIVQNQFYKKIIEHRNFNPRLISFALNEARKIEADICTSIFNNLECPAQIWDHCYTGQLDEQARILVKLCVANNGRIDDRTFKKAYTEALTMYDFHATSILPKDYDCSVKLVCDSILTRNISEKSIEYTHFNPSVSDYVIDRIANLYDAKNLIACLDNPSCVSFFVNLIITKSKMRGAESRELSEHLLKCYGNEFGESFCHSLRLAFHLDNDSELFKGAFRLFEQTINNPDFHSSVGNSLLSTLISESIRYKIRSEAVVNVLHLRKFDEAAITKIYDAIHEDNPHNDLLDSAKGALIEYMKDVADDYITTDDGYSDCTSTSDLDALIDQVFENLSSEYPMLNEYDIEEIKCSLNYSSLKSGIREDDEDDDYDEDEYRSSRSDSIRSRQFTEDEIIDSMFKSSSQF